MVVSLTLAGVSLRRRLIPDLGVPRVCVVREHRGGILALKLSRIGEGVSRVRGQRPSAYPALPSPTT
jgi:hypothetical protein